MVNDKLDQIKLLSQFTEAEAIKATNIIWNDIQREYKSLSNVSKPEGIITGGTPGAGKSVFVKLAKNRLNDNLLVIDGDQYRKFHPNFAKLQKLVGSDIAFVTGPFYGKMVRNILTKAMDHKYNVIIESTFKSVDSPLDYLKALKAAGYTTTVNIVAVDKEVAWQSTIERKEKMIAAGEPSRSVDRTYFDQTAANLAGNAEKVYKTGLVDKLEVRNRTTRLFDSRFNDISQLQNIIKKELGLLKQVNKLINNGMSK